MRPSLFATSHKSIFSRRAEPTTRNKKKVARIRTPAEDAQDAFKGAQVFVFVFQLYGALQMFFLSTTSLIHYNRWLHLIGGFTSVGGNIVSSGTSKDLVVSVGSSIASQLLPDDLVVAGGSGNGEHSAYFEVHHPPRTWSESLPTALAFIASFLLFNGLLVFVMWRSSPGFVPLEVTGDADASKDEAASSPTFKTGFLCDKSAKDRSAIPVNLRFCETCLVWQPLRSKHCDKCDRCVACYDHHCFWIGRCVGVENHPQFVVMLLAGVIYHFLAIVFSYRCINLSVAHAYGGGVLHMTVHAIAPWCLTMLAVGLFFFAFALLVLHVYLACTAQTTWEMFSRSRISYLCEFDRAKRLEVEKATIGGKKLPANMQNGNPFHMGSVGNNLKEFVEMRKRWIERQKKRCTDAIV